MARRVTEAEDFHYLKIKLNGCEQILLEPYEYLLQVPGKDVRGKLIDSFNKWLQISEPELNQIKTIVSMLHNSSLLYLHSFLLSLLSFSSSRWCVVFTISLDPNAGSTTLKTTPCSGEACPVGAPCATCSLVSACAAWR
jgi:hypothetical protein